MSSIDDLKKMCGSLNIRPLISKQTGEASFEACAGLVQGKKVRKTFGAKNWGSVEEAFAQAKRWLGETGRELRSDLSAFISVPHPIRPQIAYALDLCERKNLPFLEVFEAGVRTLEQEKAINPITFNQAVEKLIEAKRMENKKPEYVRNLQTTYDAFAKVFGDIRLADITADHIEDWLSERGEMSPITWNNWRRDLGILWSYALHSRNRWVKENVAEQVSTKSFDKGEVTTLTISQAKGILKTATADLPRLVPYLVLGMFCGLRRSEAQTARWEDVDWETKSIKVNSAKDRTISSRYVHLEPVALEWLELHTQPTGFLCTLEYARRNDLKALRDLTFDFDGNIFRHTYGSYHSQGFKNSAATAAEMGHSTVQMLNRYYRKPIPALVAMGFWKLTPDAVL